MVKNIVIIGGGYAGVMLVTKLERSISKHQDYRIIMIEKVQHIGAITIHNELHPLTFT